MCVMCEGRNVTVQDFNSFQRRIIERAQGYESNRIEGDTLARFVRDAVELSRIRFDTGSEWGEPTINPYVARYIFKAKDPEEGLLRFILCCWMDMQENYQTVWTRRLESISANNIPKMRMSNCKTPLIEKTKGIHRSYSGISRWFIAKILQSAEESRKKGRDAFPCFIYSFFSDLWGLENLSKTNHGSLFKMKNGETGNGLIGRYKRAWMALMWLRLDNSVVKCLFSRSLVKHENGKSALDFWYDNDAFNPKYCEMPVDGRVTSNWNRLFMTQNREREIGLEIHNLAHKFNVVPAFFDAILFTF